MKGKLHITGLLLIALAITTQTTNAQQNWVKDANNPVMDNNSNTQAWDRWYMNPTVLVVNDTLRMWYNGRKQGEPAQIGHAYSVNGGITWITNTNPVLLAGNIGDWDRAKNPNSILLENDTLKMWYTGSSDDFNVNNSIGYAKRHLNDTAWTLNSLPVLEKGTSGVWDDLGVFGPSVIFDSRDNLYKMWYHGYDVDANTPDGEIGYATSPNGINWVKDTLHNPVIEIGPNGSFYDTWLFPSAVLLMNDTLRMWFTGWDGNSTSPYYKFLEIGYATSIDGVNWVLQNNAQPVLNIGAAGSWDELQVRCGSVIVHHDSLKMFYYGFRGGSGTQIGLAIDTVFNKIGINELQESIALDMVISPNPINDRATIAFYLSKTSNASMVIYNQHGQVVASLLDEKTQTGNHELKYDTSALPAGLYFCVLKSNNSMLTKKFIKM